MTLDGLTLSVLVRELEKALIGGQIQKLIQIDKHTLLLKLNTMEGVKDLVITVGAQPSIYLSQGIDELPKEPSSLCMYLRKHLEGGRIVQLEQINDDRLIKIVVNRLSLKGVLESKNIYVELMGKHSNCIIVEDSQIIEALIHVTPLMSSDHIIAPKLTYELPPNSNRMSLGDFPASMIQEILQTYGQDSIGQSLRRLFNGIGNALLDEFFHGMPFTKDTLIQHIDNYDLCHFTERLVALYGEIKGSSQLYEYVDKKGKSTYSPISLSSMEGTPLIHSQLSPLLEAKQKKSGSMQTSQQKLGQIIKQAIKKENNRYKKIQGELKEAEKSNLYKLYGDLLMIHAHLPHEYKKEISLINVLSEEQELIKIPLKKELTTPENGQFYYKLYNKLKKRFTNCKEQLEGSLKKSEYYETILFGLLQSTSTAHLEEIRKECVQAGLIREQKRNLQLRSEKPDYMTIPIDDGKIIIGRNNKQNDYITHKLGRPHDLWFHALHMQGSHVLLQVNHEPTEEEIARTASYAAYYSKGQEDHKVPVDYTYIKHIKKPPASPLGYVIYTNQKTLIVSPQKPYKEKES